MLELILTDILSSLWAGAKFLFVLFAMLLPFILISLIDWGVDELMRVW
jgi:hypothetical protein